ncbi:MAG: nucleoside monophosphate kinase [Rickettsiales bacterium]|jgi:adenylate kinase|nr:nucleoside monophosphate kinase [Rickettsiales bacterium]
MLKIIFIGPAGSGKGTQGTLITKQYGIPLISTGGLLRSRSEKNDELARHIDDTLARGGFVNDNLIFSMLKEKLAEDDCKDGFIIDGFPRNISQAKTLDEFLGESAIDAVIVLNIPRDDIFKRMIGRFECTKCKAMYNKFYGNTKVDGVCDACGSTDFSIRDDDSNIHAIVKRLDLYDRMSKELIEYYAEKNLIYSINALKDIQEIFKDIENILNKLLEQKLRELDSSNKNKRL